MIQASLLGNIGRNAEISEYQGTKLIRFAVAVNGKDKDSVQWLQCTLWGDRGVKLNPHLIKGTKVFVTGELAQTLVKNKVGEEVALLNVRVNNLEFASPKPEAKPNLEITVYPTPSDTDTKQEPFSYADFSNEIPF